MNESLLQWLRCPFCGGKFHGPKSARVMHAPGYGILTCPCSHYPIVAGIPILKTNDPSVTEAVQQIEAGRYEQVLLSLIQRPLGYATVPAWVRSLSSIKGMWRLEQWYHQRAL